MTSALQKKCLLKLPKILRILRQEVRAWKEPIVGTFADGAHAPFKVLISTVLSLRTKDSTTEKASKRLFARAEDPETMLRLSAKEIEKLIYPVGFYRTKARNVLSICRSLLEKHRGVVPADLKCLLELRGVGRKTANLVRTVAYGKPGICVDTHVHRISNRWGLVRTRTPEETEMELRRVLPKRYWIEFNDLLVCYGQNLCVPVSPFCSRCKLSGGCPKVGVKSRR